MAAKQYKLDLASVLQAIDRRDLDFYNRLSDEDKKGYVPLVLMRYMSSVTDQNKNAVWAVWATNDLVNVGFWQLDKHKELQHKLLCLCGLGSKQYRPWIAAKRSKSKNKIMEFLSTVYPDLKEDDVEILYQNLNLESLKDFLSGAGIPDSEIKNLVSEWKKLNK